MFLWLRFMPPTAARRSMAGWLKMSGALALGRSKDSAFFRATIASSGTSAPSLLGRYERWQGIGH
jgi:hypothetical protein